MATNKTHIAIIGAGSMGSAIARAIAHGEEDVTLTVIDRNTPKLNLLTKECGDISTTKTFESLGSADVVVLAVKPQGFSELANEIKKTINKNALVISIMAGVSIKNISKALGVKKVVHAMPNLGAQFGESMTVWAGEGLSTADKQFASIFFSILGEEMYVANEDLVNKNTAVSGSGVGFFAYMIEAYMAEVKALGFKEGESEQIVLQTLKATNTILQNRQYSPKELRERVTSKKGTTEAGLSVLMKKEFKNILKKTLTKAYSRAKQLSK